MTTEPHPAIRTAFCMYCRTARYPSEIVEIQTQSRQPRRRCVYCLPKDVTRKPTTPTKHRPAHPKPC